jgi:hypothetical protein
MWFHSHKTCRSPGSAAYKDKESSGGGKPSGEKHIAVISIAAAGIAESASGDESDVVLCMLDSDQYSLVNRSPTVPRIDGNWILDSGCTSHSTFDVSDLSGLQYFQRAKPITGFDGGSVEARGSGSTEIKTSMGYTLGISEMMYTPGARFKLISIGRLCDSGFTVTFEATVVYLWYDRQVVAIGTRRSKSLYALSLPDTPIIAVPTAAVATDDKVDCMPPLLRSINDTQFMWETTHGARAIPGRMDDIDIVHATAYSSDWTIVDPNDDRTSDPEREVAVVAQPTTETWHRRLGHLAFDAVVTLANRGLATGMPSNLTRPPPPLSTLHPW